MPSNALAALDLPLYRRYALGGLLRQLARGERIAQIVAERQASMAPGVRERRFLHAQSQQECMHARVFDTAGAWLGAPRLTGRDRVFAAFEERVIDAATHARFDETVIATQVVLEALGEALLDRLDCAIARHGDAFNVLRRRIRRQEAAHHAFGIELVQAMLASAALTRTSAVRIAAPYVALVEEMIESARPELDVFATRPAQVIAEVRARLPHWIQP